MQTADAREKFLASRLNAEPKTLEAYSWALDKLEALYPDTLPTTELEINDMFGAYAYLAAATRKSLLGRLKVFWGWLARNGLANNPIRNVKHRGRRRHNPYTLSLFDVTRMLDSALSERDFILLSLFMDTGMRLSEAQSITTRRINAAAGNVTVDGKTGDRVVPVSPAVIDGMLRIAKGPDVWVKERKGGRLQGGGVQQDVKRCMLRAGLPRRKLGPHILRHTFGLQYILAGGDVFSLMEIMGHADVSTTMLYVYMAHSQAQEQHSKFSPVAKMVRNGDFDVGLAAVQARQQSGERWTRGAKQGGTMSGRARRAKANKMRAKARRLSSKGMSNEEIADLLECNVRTVTRKYLAD